MKTALKVIRLVDADVVTTSGCTFLNADHFKVTNDQTNVYAYTYVYGTSFLVNYTEYEDYAYYGVDFLTSFPGTVNKGWYHYDSNNAIYVYCSNQNHTKYLSKDWQPYTY